MAKPRRRAAVRPLKPIMTVAALLAAIALALLASQVVRYTYTPSAAAASGASAAADETTAPAAEP